MSRLAGAVGTVFLCRGVRPGRLRRQPSPALRRYSSPPGQAPSGLIITSRSGHAAITLAALLILGSAWGLRICRATLRTFLTILLVFCIIVPVCLWLATSR